MVKPSPLKRTAGKADASASRVFVYPGTFDPVTFGHLNIIARGAALCDRLVVGIASGGGAGKNPIFPPETRAEMLRQEIADMGISHKVDVVVFSSLLIDFLKQCKSRTVLRGLRGAADFEYEMSMAAANAVLYENCETVFLRAHPGATFVSSTMVREIARHQGDLSKLVPERVAEKLKKLF